MISKLLKEKVLELRNEGKSLSIIANILKISKSSVHYVLSHKYKILKKKSGPKNIINRRLSQRIKRAVAKLNNDGTKVNCSSVLRDMNIGIKRRTLNNWFLKQKYQYTNRRQRFSLTKDHKIKRISLVRKWIEERLDFQNGFFSDEKMFSLDGPDNL